MPQREWTAPTEVCGRAQGSGQRVGVGALAGCPGCSGNPVRQMSLTQSEAGCGSECAVRSSWRSRARAQCLSARGLHLRRCERRWRPGPPRQSASRQRAGLRAARLTAAVRKQCGRETAEACGACLQPVGPGGCVRAGSAATWRVRCCRRGACGSAGPGARGRAQRAQVQARGTFLYKKG